MAILDSASPAAAGSPYSTHELCQQSTTLPGVPARWRRGDNRPNWLDAGPVRRLLDDLLGLSRIGLAIVRRGISHPLSSTFKNRMRNMPDWLDPSLPLLPRVLQQAGYRTAHYGKWHLSSSTILDAPHPREYGYDDAAAWGGPARGIFDGTSLDNAQRPSTCRTRTPTAW